MASWWRRYAEEIGAQPNGKSWRRAAEIVMGVTREDLAPFKGGWVRRMAEYYGRMSPPGSWARRLNGAQNIVGWNDNSNWNDNGIWDDDGTN